MGKFSGKLLVSDMDATLLNSDHMVSKGNREAIEYFISEGGKFTVATGRMVPAVRAYFSQMRINAPALLHMCTENAVKRSVLKQGHMMSHIICLMRFGTDLG